MKPSNLSGFASTLRAVMDESLGICRSEWAELLDVSEAAISQWLNDKTIPRAECLRSIVRCLKDGSDSEQVLKEFWEMAGKPLVEVSPLGFRNAPSVAAYMILPVQKGFLDLLATREPGAQESILFLASSLCRKESLFDDAMSCNRNLSELIRFLDALNDLESDHQIAILNRSLDSCKKMLGSSFDRGLFMNSTSCFESSENEKVKDSGGESVSVESKILGKVSDYFVFGDGRVVHAGTNSSSSEDRDRFDNTTIEFIESATRQAAMGATSPAELAAADAMRRGPTPNPLLDLSDRRVSTNSAYCFHEVGSFSVGVLVYPGRPGNIDIELIVVDADSVPVSNAKVLWKHKKISRSIPRFSGQEWITSCESGRISFHLVLPGELKFDFDIEIHSNPTLS